MFAAGLVGLVVINVFLIGFILFAQHITSGNGAGNQLPSISGLTALLAPFLH